MQVAQTVQLRHVPPSQTVSAAGQKLLPQVTPQAPPWQVWPVGQDIGVPPQTPSVQTSLIVQGSPSLQDVLLVLFGLEQAPVAGLQTPDVVTLIQRGTDDRVAPHAHATLAGIGLGAQVAIVAARPVRLGRIGAGAGARIAAARKVALVRRRTAHRRPTPTDPALTGFPGGAGIAIIAGGVIRLGRGGAGAGGRVADARIVALIDGRRTGDRIAAGTHPTLAGIGPRAGVPIAAGRAIRHGLALPGRIAGVTGPTRLAGAGIVRHTARGRDITPLAGLSRVGCRAWKPGNSRQHRARSSRPQRNHSYRPRRWSCNCIRACHWRQ